jgi:hypothetical protein
MNRSEPQRSAQGLERLADFAPHVRTAKAPNPDHDTYRFHHSTSQTLFALQGLTTPLFPNLHSAIFPCHHVRLLEPLF